MEKKSFFFKKVNFYEEGEQTGRLFAKIINVRSSAPTIGTLKLPKGHMVNKPETFMEELLHFYTDLYASKVFYKHEELLTYLSSIHLPCLSASQRQNLEASFSLEELQEAVGAFPNSKAQGDGGIPIEVYQTYTDLLLPKLLKVFKAARSR